MRTTETRGYRLFSRTGLCDAILSGYEDLDLPGSDKFTFWGRMSAEEILTENVNDIHRIEAKHDSEPS